MLRYILVNVLRRKGRALFAILGIGIGISAVISLEAVANGMIDGIQNMLQKLPGSHIILEKGSTGIPFSNLDDSFVEKIRKVDGVEWVEPFIFQMRKLPTYYRSD
ncbi:MAG: ABC transporter permease, partial [Candidatus Heimdallarchaeota archaeon]|nr:ABC transporter permease [Candidatus Heimdallarchaeota archaeon]